MSNFQQKIARHAKKHCKLKIVRQARCFCNKDFKVADVNMLKEPKEILLKK